MTILIDRRITALVIDPIDDERHGLERMWPRGSAIGDAANAVGGWTTGGAVVVFHYTEGPVNRAATRLWHQLNPMAGGDLHGTVVITGLAGADVPAEVVEMWQVAA
ncbi:hypothetical protein KIH27_03295 [Mycobacterium sp. M1]|uniref:Uncharacterized protein n=1 Tax=Mycolicibacter acidiphilus TaxID=2835306 RepID=A0ABS5REA6_9MYCO|nr:hypothetical protein [Mycolicibacter acidiphilus]MBS9532608.1 hypothetical protein [Mycolicibacter acidiphilus]